MVSEMGAWEVWGNVDGYPAFAAWRGGRASMETYSSVNSPPLSQNVSMRCGKLGGGFLSYRQDSEQRGLASILETDHRNIHLGRPAVEKYRLAWSAHHLGVVERWNIAAVIYRIECAGTVRTATHQNNLSSQSYTLLKRPAMIARFDTGVGLRENGVLLIEGRGGWMPECCASLLCDEWGKREDWKLERVVDSLPL